MGTVSVPWNGMEDLDSIDLAWLMVRMFLIGLNIMCLCHGPEA